MVIVKRIGRVFLLVLPIAVGGLCRFLGSLGAEIVYRHVAGGSRKRECPRCSSRIVRQATVCRYRLRDVPPRTFE